MTRTVSEIIDQLKPYQMDKVILFGSHAHGKPSEDSDVDLVLIKNTKDSFNMRLKQVRMLLHTTTSVDVFVFTPYEFERAAKTNPFIYEISKNGKVIYG